MACATRSIRAWAAWPWSEARDSRIGYNARAPRGDRGNSTQSGDDKEGSMSRSMLQMTAVIMLLVVGATGCATMEDNPKASIGALGGAAFGGLIAAAAGRGRAAHAGPVIGGALLGGFAGNALDQRDKRLAAEAQQKALETAPTGKPVAWTNPDSGHTGTITPTRTYQSGSGYCREFQNDVVIGGKSEKAYGTACRQPDGSWKVQG